MTISPKVKKILAISGGAVLFGVCVCAMAKCSSNGSERDAVQKTLTARVDSLQNALKEMTASRDAWYVEAENNKNALKELREDTSCADSVVVLNDSISVLNDSIAGLNQKLAKCNKRRSQARRGNGACRQSNTKPKRGNGNVTVVSGSDKQVTVPSNTSGTVIVNNGCNNTVNVNNGTINNYYAPENKCAPENKKIRCVSSSATVERTYVIKYYRQKCK